MGTRQNAIEIIEGMFPADDSNERTSATGQRLVIQAICEHWHDLPDDILFRYAELCEQEETRQCQFVRNEKEENGK